MQMGLREANQKFSQLMKAVKQGKEVLLTERGKPLAVVRLIGDPDEAGSAIRKLESAGVLRAASKRRVLPAWIPRSVHGTPLSRTIAMDREEA
jgi:antitoxin (DNA-binding transcriptional repressor) of toxin-antitoxin stability system